MAAILAGAVASVLGNTVKNSIVNAASKVALDKSIPEVKPADAAPVAEAMIDALSKDKKFINATNSELWWQSGVAWGLSGTQIGALAIVIPQLAENGWHISGYDPYSFPPALLIVASGVFGLIRRFVPGLKPLFSGKG